MTRIASTICLILAAIGFLSLAENPVDGCAMVRNRAYAAPIEIAEESAIIIWDEATSTQHFIRRSTYKTEAKDFGFLVPTPTQPELAESKDLAFRYLERLTAPPVILPPARAGGNKVPAAPAAAPKVEILELKRVAGFDAAVLKANDPAALNEWLKNHDYQSRPELVSWLEPYVKNGWIITAFKIAADAPKTKAINTSAVRMSFKTERPFYPYREPADQRTVQDSGQPETKSGRLLRVYVLAKERVQANLGDKAWPGKTVWARTITPGNCTLLAKHLQLSNWKPAGTWWLTELEDRSSPRPGTDELYFTASADQSVITRPAVVPTRVAPPLPRPRIEPTRKPEPANPG